MIYSPSNFKTNLNTPCAAGCCGPKFKEILFMLDKYLIYYIKTTTISH